MVRISEFNFSHNGNSPTTYQWQIGRIEKERLSHTNSCRTNIFLRGENPHSRMLEAETIFNRKYHLLNC